MPRFEITDPAGKRFEINAPEGATQEQALAYAQEQFQSQPEPSTMGRLGNAALQGFRTGGPMGALMGLAVPGIETANDLVAKGAYNTGGAVTDATGSPGLGYAANVAVQSIPTVAGAIAGSATKPTMQGSGESLMHSALKPSTTLGPRKTAQAVRTMLTEDVGNILPGANVTPKGINQLSTKQQALGHSADSLLSASPATVDTYDVARAASPVLQRAGKQVNPIGDQSSIVNSIDEFLSTNPRNIPVKLANEIKQGTYAALGDKAYKGTELKSAEVNAQKALAKGLRAEIEKQVPEVGPLNAQQSAIINALKAAISRNAVAQNRDPIGLGFIASNPAAAAAFLANRSEYVKSILARLLYSTGGSSVPTAIGAGLGGAYASQKGTEE